MATSSAQNLLRQIPPVDRLLREPTVCALIRLYGREAVRVQMRVELDRLRQELTALEPSTLEAFTPAAGDGAEPYLAELPKRLQAALGARLGLPLARVLNATGIFLHTNLGRAPLPAAVAQRLPSLLDASCDLEMDLPSGERGDRNHRVEALLSELSGAQRSLVVNNGAAAMVLVLSTLARGRSVIVSRGELVEIGGSFRIPDLLTAAGARLVEVGTTNRTRLEDYRAAINADTGLLLKVFPSNYRIVGFTSQVAPAELALLAKESEIPLLVDEGSGLLRPHRAPQLADHPSFTQLIAAGCNLVCGSGDKLLGGPQAGLLVGEAELIGRLRRHPFYRALRPDRSALAALELVLRRHLQGASMPLDRLWPNPEDHAERLAAIGRRIEAEIVEADAFVGGGSAPERPLPGFALALPGDQALLAKLRTGSPPVVGYLRDGRLVLDLRTVAARDDEALVATVLAARGL